MMVIPMKHDILIIVVIAVVSLLIKVLPFILLNRKKETPKVITYLGKVLPFAIAGMLVVYCFKDSKVIEYPYFLPEIIAVIVVVLLHLWQKKTLLSITIGTIVYMLLVQLVF